MSQPSVGCQMPVTPGTYVLRVVNFAAAVGTWNATIGAYSTTTTVTTGHTEAYTMTCEIAGNVVSTQEVTVARGQVLAVKPCGKTKAAR